MTRDRLDRKEKPPTSENRPETMQLSASPGNLATGNLADLGCGTRNWEGPAAREAAPDRTGTLLCTSQGDKAPRKRTRRPAKACCEGPRYGELRTPGAIGLKTDAPSE